MNAYITSIATSNPRFKIKQQDVLDFMIRAHQLKGVDADKLRVLYRATGILSRYSVIEDYQSSLVRQFFPDNKKLEPFPSTQERLELFQQEAITLCVEAAKRALTTTRAEQITHLITVSCTGMYAPGIDIELVDRLGLNSHVERTGINFMGCYAAFNAIKVADAICTANKGAKVLVVCVELCSIHFQKKAMDDYMLANALFGDGAAAVVVTGKPVTGVNLKTTSFFSELFRNGHEHMAWKIGNFGFEMRLSSYVPDVIESGVRLLTQKLLDKGGVDKFDYFAIHPGGKRILQVIEKELGISKRENQEAHDILSEYGNMSSPTILFVLKRVMDKFNMEDNGKNLLGLAFGPGLTLESMLLTIESH
ncbi:type III polyketide synthase [Fulvivirga sp. 29W222]|uniref:Type III polyketide synthase n=1 Tax=Fulvivirga marina TaxID=2494733 RepID=A0A937FUE4_9BACT|nr:type III polyketide synthase [Fulvivirga marina]MBL6446290.1 type III polyketide synthase [Fulvivirga marina]